MPKYRLCVYDADDRMIAPAMVISADTFGANTIEHGFRYLGRRLVERREAACGHWAAKARFRDRDHRTHELVADYQVGATLRAGMMASRLNHREHVIPAQTDHLADKAR